MLRSRVSKARRAGCDDRGEGGGDPNLAGAVDGERCKVARRLKIAKEGDGVRGETSTAIGGVF